MEKTPNLFAPLWPEHPLYIPIGTLFLLRGFVAEAHLEKIYSPIEELKSYTPNPKAPGGTGYALQCGVGVAVRVCVCVCVLASCVQAPELCFAAVSAS